ncbi:MAG: hypothetical protein NTV97_23720 [Alphaproteobacteria bacterium]|nr:hypothetical protein [Alphaproteobacteria bacterium]
MGDHVVFNGTTWEKWEGVLTSAELIAALGFTPANKAGDTLTGDLAQGTAYKFLWTGRGGIGSSADGVLVLLDTAGTSFGRLQFGGTTASFPALKRSATTLAARLADDTDDAPFSGSAFKTTAANVNAQTGTSYSLVDADNGKVVTLSNASAITLTVPSGLAAGFSCTLVQLGAGQVTITASSTNLRHRNGLKLGGQYAQAGLFYLAADTYSVGGDLTT